MVINCHHGHVCYIYISASATSKSNNDVCWNKTCLSEQIISMASCEKCDTWWWTSPPTHSLPLCASQEWSLPLSLSAMFVEKYVVFKVFDCRYFDCCWSVSLCTFFMYVNQVYFCERLVCWLALCMWFFSTGVWWMVWYVTDHRTLYFKQEKRHYIYFSSCHASNAQCNKLFADLIMPFLWLQWKRKK